MKSLILLILLASALFAEDAPNPELDVAKARIVWLEQSLAAAKDDLSKTQLKSGRCFEALNGIFSVVSSATEQADMKLNQLAQQEPKAQEPKKAEATGK